MLLWCEQKKQEKCQSYLTDKNLWALLEHCDAELAEKCREEGCRHCGGKLHQAHYWRKPRGVAEAESRASRRHSFCCGREGCRKRHTPPSVRFLGRRIYVGVVVVLMSALRHGLKPKGVELLREKLGIDRRTLERWRKWWLEDFVQSRFWRAVRSRLAAPFCQKSLPLSLCEAFEIEPGSCLGDTRRRRDRLLDLLRFLSPLGGSARLFEHGF